MLRVRLIMAVGLLALLASMVQPTEAQEHAASTEQNSAREIPEDIWRTAEAGQLEFHPHWNDEEEVRKRSKQYKEPRWAGYTPLAVAVANDDRAVARLMLSEGSDPNGMVDPELFAGQRTSPLGAAIHNSNVQAAAFLFQVGADPDLNDAIGQTGLLQDHKVQVALTRLLIERNVNILPNTVETFAASGASEAFELILNNGGKINHKAGDRFLKPTIFNTVRSPANLRIALNQGADPNAVNVDRSTPLHHAALVGPLESTEILLEVGANVNVRNHDAETPIEVALARYSLRAFGESVNTGIVRALLQRGSETSIAAEVATGNVEALAARKREGQAIVGLSPLPEGAGWAGTNEARSDLIAMATVHGQMEALKWLLENGIRETSFVLTGSRDELRMDTPALVIAAFQGNVESVKLLLEAGSDPNETTSNSLYVHSGVAPLHAVFIGMGQGNWSTPDRNRGSSPIEISAEALSSRKQIIEVLLGRGANPDQLDRSGRLTARAMAKNLLPNDDWFPAGKQER